MSCYHLCTVNFTMQQARPKCTSVSSPTFNIAEEEEGSMEGRPGVMEVSKGLLPPNPIVQLQARFKDLEVGFRAWLSKQSLPVEAAVVTATSAVQGAAIGAFMGTLTNDASSVVPNPPPQAALNPQAMACFKQAQALLGVPLCKHETLLS